MKTCPTPEQLAAFAKGSLTVEVAESLKAHLRSCGTCSPDAMRMRVSDEPSEPTPFLSIKPQLLFEPLARGAALGRYVVLDVLGRGGMGVVYAAYDPELDRKVAVKRLFTSNDEQGSAGRDRLLREAQAMARLSHPNVLAVHDVGTLPDGSVYLAMDLVEGRTLRDWLVEQKPRWREISAVLHQAGEGLWAAHQAGLVHRDFKPDNVLVRRDGRVFVTDFGLAKARGAEAKEPAPTGARAPLLSVSKANHSDPMIGTPAYMAPEQFSGGAGSPLTDQFSFGVTLYQALYQQRPYDVDPRGQSSWKVKEPPKGSDVPLWLRKVALRCVALKPGERYADLGAALAALAADPTGRRKTLAVRAAVAAGVVAVSGVALSMGRAQAVQCESAGGSISSVWSAERRTRIREAFSRSGDKQFEQAWTRVEPVLDTYVNGWRAMRVEACEATRRRGEQSDEVLTLRMQCLDERRNGVAALVEVFERANAATVGKSVQAAHALGDLRECADVESLRRPVKPPRDPQRALEVAQIREGLARVEALRQTVHFTEARELLGPLLERARAVGYRPVEAEALFIDGKILKDLSDQRADVMFEEALWTAQAGRSDELAARILTAQVAEDLNFLRTDVVKARVRKMNAMIERVGNPDSLRWLSLILNTWGDLPLDQQMASLEEGVALARKLYGDARPETAHAWNLAGNRMGDLQQWHKALDAHTRGLEVRERVFGPDHTEVGISLLNIALDGGHTHEWARAIEAGRRAVAVLSRSVADDAVVTNVARVNLGEALRDAGQMEEALAVLNTGFGHLSAKMTLNEPIFQMTTDSLASAELRMGQASRALARYEQLLSLPADVVDPKERRVHRLRRAACLLEQKQPREALTELEEVVPTIVGGDMLNRADFEGEASFALARARWETGQKTPEVRVLASSAISTLRAENRLHLAGLAQTWLDAQEGQLTDRR